MTPINGASVPVSINAPPPGSPAAATWEPKPGVVIGDGVEMAIMDAPPTALPIPAPPIYTLENISFPGAAPGGGYENPAFSKDVGFQLDPVVTTTLLDSHRNQLPTLPDPDNYLDRVRYIQQLQELLRSIGSNVELIVPSDPSARGDWADHASEGLGSGVQGVAGVAPVGIGSPPAVPQIGEERIVTNPIHVKEPALSRESPEEAQLKRLTTVTEEDVMGKGGSDLSDITDMGDMSDVLEVSAADRDRILGYKPDKLAVTSSLYPEEEIRRKRRNKKRKFVPTSVSRIAR